MSVPDQKVVDRRTQVSPDEGVTVQMVLQEQKPHFEQQATVLQLRNSSKAVRHGRRRVTVSLS